MGILVREIECKSVLNRSGLADYAINCYASCGHGCVYCYARFATRFSHPGALWGSFVYVRVNAPAVLGHVVKRRKPGRVFLSTVCDAWQPVEERYGFSCQCLEILLRYRFKVEILTKSALVGRDMDVLSSCGADVSLGVTMTTLNEGLRRIIEPGSSPTMERIELHQQAARRGIRTYAFLGPLLPCLSDMEENIGRLLREVKRTEVEYIYFDCLNRRFGVWQSIRDILHKNYPDLIHVYRNLFFDERARQQYYKQLTVVVQRLVAEYGLESKIRLCF